MLDIVLMETKGEKTGKLFDRLEKDIRFKEGLRACINCGMCTASCPAAAFFDYDPRLIMDTVQKRDDDRLTDILKSEQIWYCGQCMSCKARCPRGNAPGIVIQALRGLAQESGCFILSVQGRYQTGIQRLIGENILHYGYCIYPDTMNGEDHPEQGPVWEWQKAHLKAVSRKTGANYKRTGNGALRTLDNEVLEELRLIFEFTGAFDRFARVDRFCGIDTDEWNSLLATRRKNDKR